MSLPAEKEEQVIKVYKFGDKVIVRDGSVLDGATGIVYQIKEDKISVLLDKEVLWPVDPYDLEYADR